MITLSVVLLLLAVYLIFLKGVLDTKDNKCVNTSTTPIKPVDISSPEEKKELSKEARQMLKNVDSTSEESETTTEE